MTEQLAGARRQAETDAWRHPIDPQPILHRAAEELPRLLEAGEGKTWDDMAELNQALLGDHDPFPGRN